MKKRRPYPGTTTCFSQWKLKTKLFGETLSAIGIFKPALQITVDSIGTLENAVSWLSWIELKRTWEMNPHLPPCCYTRLWIIRESLSVRGTPWGIWEIGWNFQGFESWNIQWGQKNTRQLRLQEWKQPKQARRWLARFFFIQKMFTLNLLTHYLFLCELTITTVAMTTPAPSMKWLLWQLLFTFGSLLILYLSARCWLSWQPRPKPISMATNLYLVCLPELQILFADHK